MAYCQTPGFVYPVSRVVLCQGLIGTASRVPMRRLQESMGKSARLRPAKPGLAAFPLLAKPITCGQVQEALFAAFWRPHGFVPSKAPAKLPARGLAGIVRSIYGTMPKPGRTSNNHW